MSLNKKKIAYSEYILLVIFIIINLLLLKNYLIEYVIIFNFLIILLLIVVNQKVALFLFVIEFPLIFQSLYYLDKIVITYYYFTLLFLIFIQIMILLRSTEITTNKNYFSLKLLYIFLILIFISLSFLSQTKSYGFFKFRYLSLSILFLSIIFFNVSKPIDISKFIRALHIFGLYLIVISFCYYFKYNNKMFGEYGSRFSIFLENPIWTARYISYSVIGMTFSIIISKSILKRAILFFLIMIQIYFVLLTASRGPLLSLLIGLFTLFLSYARNYKKIILAILIIIILLMLLINLSPQKVRDRLFSKNTEGQSTSFIRFMLNILAIQIFLKNVLFGVGFGGFSSYTQVFKYPHNMLTEILCELGLIIFLLFIYIFLYQIKILRSLKFSDYRIYYPFIVALLSTTFVNTFFSGHIGSNNFFWITLGLISSIGLQNPIRQEYHKEIYQ